MMLPGLAMSLFPLHTTGTEELQALEATVRHGQPVDIPEIFYYLKC